MRLVFLLVAAPFGGNVAGRMLLNERAAVAGEPQEHPPLGAMEKRDVIPWGGYYLLVKDGACPANTSKCSTTGCCPNGTFCFANPKAGGYAVCCPDENVDCSETVLRVYACADTSWTMWSWVGENFCCKADEVGTHANFEDRCLPTSVPVPSSIIVKSVDQQTRTVPKPTATGSSGGGSQTTGIATPKGGTSTPSPAGTGTCDPASYAKDPTGCSNDGPPVTNFEPPSDPESGSGTSSGTPNSNSNGSGSGSSSSSNSGGSDGGLSTPATIAIAVLATALGLALVFLAWFLWYRSHKKKQIVAAAAASSGGTSELPGASANPGAPAAGPQVAQVTANYPPPGVTTAPAGFVPYANTGPIPVSPQQHLAQTAVVPIHSTPSPGPSLDPSLGPPAYVPPHPHTQELHARGMTPVLEGFQGYGVTLNSAGHAASPNGEQELDGMGRARSPVDAIGHPGGNAGGLEDCPPPPGQTGYGRT